MKKDISLNESSLITCTTCPLAQRMGSNAWSRYEWDGWMDGWWENEGVHGSPKLKVTRRTHNISYAV